MALEAATLFYWIAAIFGVVSCFILALMPLADGWGRRRPLPEDGWELIWEFVMKRMHVCIADFNSSYRQLVGFTRDATWTSHQCVGYTQRVPGGTTW